MKFVGYDTFETHRTELWRFSVRTNTASCSLQQRSAKGWKRLVITGATPFYGESGGQVGDTGTITTAGARAEVLDTTKTENDVILHRVKVIKGTLAKGETVQLQVNGNRRLSIMRHHSATHLLQRALRDVLGDHVHQSGSLVNR